MHIESCNTTSQCLICLDSSKELTSQFAEREVVATSCHPLPHHFHLDCARRWLSAFEFGKQRCAVCNQQPLPLIRVEGARLNERSPYCEHLALHVCRNGDLEKLQKLIELDPTIACQDFYLPQTAEEIRLEWVAAEKGHIDCLRALIDAGAQRLDKALKIAAENDHTPCLELLIDSGADLGAAVYMAVADGNTSTVKCLADYGANLT